MRQVVAVQGTSSLPLVGPRGPELELDAGMLMRFAEKVLDLAGPYENINLSIRDNRIYAVWGKADEGLRHHSMEI